MRQLNRLASLLAIVALLTVSTWSLGCGEPANDSGTDTTTPAPAGTTDGGGDAAGSSTGGGTETP